METVPPSRLESNNFLYLARCASYAQTVLLAFRLPSISLFPFLEPRIEALI